MNLIALGINHNSAGVEVRERVAFAPEQVAEALENACEQAGLDEVVILSTCNRTELYAMVPDNCKPADKSARLIEWMANYHHLSSQELRQAAYYHEAGAALQHMVKVASGLDSMVLGEPQILGQLKSAYAVSVAYAAVDLAGHIFSDLSRCDALLVGAGETVELVARHLVEAGVRRIVIANRTLGRARELAQKFGAEAVLLADIPEHLLHSDIVITSTASQLPILGKGAVEQAIKARKHRPILMVDIAVPRDIEPQVAELADIYLYTVDDLREIVEQNLRSRQSEARKADLLIEEGVAQVLEEVRSLAAVDTVRQYREMAESIREQELQRALRSLARGDDPQQIVAQLARGITNKLIHAPTAGLKRASADGRQDLLAGARKLLGLESVVGASAGGTAAGGPEQLPEASSKDPSRDIPNPPPGQRILQ